MPLNRIIQKKILAPGIVLFEIENPDIASHAFAGQFVVVRKDEFAERVPLTIADFDPLKGTLVLIIQEVGVSTKKLCSLEEGGAIRDVLGPLGHPTEIAKFGTEFEILLKASRQELLNGLPKRVAEGVLRVREGKVDIKAGFDGEYGQISIFNEADAKRQDEQQLKLF